MTSTHTTLGSMTSIGPHHKCISLSKNEQFRYLFWPSNCSWNLSRTTVRSHLSASFSNFHNLKYQWPSSPTRNNMRSTCFSSGLFCTEKYSSPGYLKKKKLLSMTWPDRLLVWTFWSLVIYIYIYIFVKCIFLATEFFFLIQWHMTTILYSVCCWGSLSLYWKFIAFQDSILHVLFSKLLFCSHPFFWFNAF